MKGIVLAGGLGTRLYPLTIGTSKQLLPIYNKPLIYYPLSTLMQAGIRDLLFIVNAEHQSAFKHLLGDGTSLGCRFAYTIQQKPNGIAEAFLIGEKFIGDDSVVLVLGDNLFYGAGLEALLMNCTSPEGGIIFAYHVHSPERYGVVSFDAEGRALDIEEKPHQPRSRYAVPGIYFYDNEVVSLARSLRPSARGELEITDLNRLYLNKGRLTVKVLERGTTWMDAGTFASLRDAQSFIHTLEERQGVLVGAIEEVAYRKGYIHRDQLRALAEKTQKSGYGTKLLALLNGT